MCESAVFRPSLYTTKNSLPGTYSQLSRALDVSVFAVALSCTRLLTMRRGNGVTITRVLSRAAVKSPTGKLTQFNDTPGSRTNRAEKPSRPVWLAVVLVPP